MTEEEIKKLLDNLPLTSIKDMIKYMEKNGWTSECTPDSDSICWYFEKEEYKTYFSFDYYDGSINISVLDPDDEEIYNSDYDSDTEIVCKFERK